MKKTNKKGFTIVELVIVIAVIAILSAVLIPTFGGVINDANEAARDADAKAVYTEYVTKCVQANPPADPAVNLYITIVDGSTSYYYAVTNGELNLTETTTAPTAPTGFEWKSAASTLVPEVTEGQAITTP